MAALTISKCMATKTNAKSYEMMRDDWCIEIPKSVIKGFYAMTHQLSNIICNCWLLVTHLHEVFVIIYHKIAKVSNRSCVGLFIDTRAIKFSGFRFDKNVHNTKKRSTHFNLSNLVSRSNLSRSQTSYIVFAGEGVKNMGIYTRRLI